MKVLVLGGGMAGLAAAHRLAKHGEISVVQRGWRLGGKGASHRTAAGRIEEHGLHVWLGYYDNAFRLMRQVYEHLDRPRTDPACPLSTWRDGFLPADDVVVFEQHLGAWTPWAAHLRRNARVPGLPGGGPTLDDLVRRGLGLLADLASSVAWRSHRPETRRAVYLSARPPATRVTTPADRLRDLDDLIRRAELIALIAASQASNALGRISPTFGIPMVEPVVEAVYEARRELGRRLAADRDARRLWHVADLVTTALIGIYTDRLLDPGRGYAAINHVDFREWLAGHGADAATIDCGLVRGMYDLVFGYRDGDHARPAFEAGTGLQLAGRFFFDYKGSLMWKMRAGMGDVVFAPLYQSLVARGVDFRFLHRIRRLRLHDGGRHIEAVELGRQARLRPGVDRYQPLTRVDGLPCFPDHPLEAQLAGSISTRDPETHPWCPSGRPDDVEREEVVTLRRGRDFEQVVLAVSLGMVPHVADELIEADPRWAAMVANVSTIATRSLQVWTATDEDAMGWPHAGSTSAGYKPPFDTYASMSHLLDAEGRRPGGPAAVSYFCSVLPEAEAVPATAASRTMDTARSFLERGTDHIWPRMRTPDGEFRWQDVLAMYTRANVDPSDRYVQSLPGSGDHRIPADASGFDNLTIAGDWTDSGLNAGCIEAAVISGLQAANTVLGKEVDDDVLGGWAPIRGAGRRET